MEKKRRKGKRSKIVTNIYMCIYLFRIIGLKASYRATNASSISFVIFKPFNIIFDYYIKGVFYLEGFHAFHSSI